MTKRGQAMQKRKHPLDRDEYFHYNIMLGSACNWRCPYCIQSEEPIKQSDPYKFCNQFVRYLTRTKQIDKVYSFSFWGGEPLLYHNTLEILIKELSKIPMKRPIRVTSNGSLLTKNNYTVFNKYGINFEISYHEGQLTDDKWEIALRIENLSVSSLITHKILDWDFYKSEWYKIYQKFGRFVKWGIFPVITAGKNVNDYALTKEDIDEHFSLLYKHLSDLNDAFYSHAYNTLLYGMSSKGLYKYGNKCFNSHTIDIDLYGNRYSCHHDYSSLTKIGNIFTDIPIYSIKYPTISDSCKSCKAFRFCTAGCHRCKDKSNECYYYNKLADLYDYIKQNYFDWLHDKSLESL